jgi:NADH dehydrogenase (ubiquinone) Fe-S protein 6
MLATFNGITTDYLCPIIKTNVEELFKANKQKEKLGKVEDTECEPTEILSNGHTGQEFAFSEYRRGRIDYVCKNEFSVDLSKEQPVVVSEKNVVWSGGGAVGFPKVFLNIEKDKVHHCSYSGRRFILKKYYDPAKHGKSITYEEYLQDLDKLDDDINLIIKKY